MSQPQQAGAAPSDLEKSQLFHSVQAFNWSDEAHTYREGFLLDSAYQFKHKSHAKAPSQTHPEYCLFKYLGTPRPSQADTLTIRGM